MSTTTEDDADRLESLGYAQELMRNMGGFSNFAISFSIICILAGGITTFHLGFCAIGGAAIGIGWPVSCALSLLMAATMGQVASAFPTAGGLYHWASILGGRAWGWLTAWLNLAGLVTVLASINVGVYLFTVGSLGPLLGISFPSQAVAVILITLSQAVFNHLGIRITSFLTDMSGYLILGISVLLTGSMLAGAAHWDFSRLVDFHNYSGPAGHDVWPYSPSLVYVFLLGLLLPAYTITGYDASAHTAEETLDAARNVPAGMVRAVFFAGLFGWLMLISIVLAMPGLDQAAAAGDKVVAQTMASVLSRPMLIFLYVGISAAQYLCGLATVTSASRMVYAFARDGGLPASRLLRQVSHRYKTPAVAIWTMCTLSVLFALYTPDLATLGVVSVVFLYLSYVTPVALGFFAYKKSWTVFGPWTMGMWYRPAAAVCVLGCAVIFYAGFQPPNEKALGITCVALAVAACLWFGLERRRFPGPPAGLMAPRSN